MMHAIIEAASAAMILVVIVKPWKPDLPVAGVAHDQVRPVLGRRHRLHSPFVGDISVIRPVPLRQIRPETVAAGEVDKEAPHDIGVSHGSGEVRTDPIDGPTRYAGTAFIWEGHGTRHCANVNDCWGGGSF